MYVLCCIGEDKERFGKQSKFVVFLIVLAIIFTFIIETMQMHVTNKQRMIWTLNYEHKDVEIHPENGLMINL